MKTLVVLVTVLVANVQAWDFRNLTVQDLNDFIDLNLIPKVQQLIISNGDEPAVSPDFTYKFQYDLEGTTHNGTLNVTNGVIHNVSTIYRTGETELWIYPTAYLIEVYTHLTFSEMTFAYDYSLSNDYRGKVQGEITNTDIYMQELVYFDTNITATWDYSFEQQGNFTIKFTDSNQTQWVEDMLVQKSSSYLQYKILDVIRAVSSKQVEKILNGPDIFNRTLYYT